MRCSLLQTYRTSDPSHDWQHPRCEKFSAKKFAAATLMPVLTIAWIAAGPCVINVYINYERKFAFVELRTGVLPVLSSSNPYGVSKTH